MAVGVYSCPICGSTFTAKDANEDINPDEVQAAVEACNNALEEDLTNITTSLEGSREDICNAIRNYNKDYGHRIDSLEESMNDIKSTCKSALEGLYEEAVQIHDTKQDAYNSDAERDKNSCIANHRAAVAAASMNN